MRAYMGCQRPTKHNVAEWGRSAASEMMCCRWFQVLNVIRRRLCLTQFENSLPMRSCMETLDQTTCWSTKAV